MRADGQDRGGPRCGWNEVLLGSTSLGLKIMSDSILVL